MLPEFPRAHEAIQKVWNKLMFAGLGFSDPLMSQVRVRPQKEGNRTIYGDSPINYKKSFDENGVPLWPQFFLSEEALAEIRQSMNLPTPEQVQRLDELVAKKRKEFDEREARRRLVD